MPARKDSSSDSSTIISSRVQLTGVHVLLQAFLLHQLVQLHRKTDSNIAPVPVTAWGSTARGGAPYLVC
jgi:hypothetical protein